MRWNILNVHTKEKDLLNLLLENRGILTDDEKKRFLNPPAVEYFLKELPVEFKQSLKKARELVLQAINDNIPIIIHGDYDADGICATAIIYNTLTDELNYNKTSAFIPNRFEHGYGLSEASIKNALEKLKSEVGDFEKVLFITVDSGITAVKEVEYIKSLGHLVIITDHHQKPEKLPDADCIVWNDAVVGSTISWLLSKVLGSKNKQDIALAGLATVTDVQLLTGFNRTLVKNALEVLNTNPPHGIKKLIDISGKSNGEITTYDLGWVIGPRLNAAGRIEDAHHSLTLLVEKNLNEIESSARKLHAINQNRQDVTLEMFELAAGINDANMPKVLISHDEKYHEGIIGLVASRLVQKYYRPSIVMSVEDGYAKGSVRSVSGIDIISMLQKFSDLFVNVGGHPMAAGFTIDLKNLDVFKEKFTLFCNEEIDETLLVPVLDVDAEFTDGLPSLTEVENLDKLKPFGIGNNEPKFLSKGMGITQTNWVGGNKQHLSLKFYKDNEYYKAIYFNAFDKPENFDLKLGDVVDVVYKLKKDSYNGNDNLNLIVVDLKKRE